MVKLTWTGSSQGWANWAWWAFLPSVQSRSSNTWSHAGNIGRETAGYGSFYVQTDVYSSLCGRRRTGAAEQGGPKKDPKTKNRVACQSWWYAVVMWQADVYNCVIPLKTSKTWVTSSGRSSNVSKGKHIHQILISFRIGGDTKSLSYYNVCSW